MESTASKTDGSGPLQSQETVMPSQPQPSQASEDVQVQKYRSKAWDHFKKIEPGDKAQCIHCHGLIACLAQNRTTTSAMLNHIKRCKVLVPEVKDEDRDGKKLKQTTMHHAFTKENDGVSSYLTFDQNVCRQALARWIIVDEMPFRTVEREGFKDAMSVIQPRFILPSRRTLVRDGLDIYENERLKLGKFFKKYKGNLCLTTDLWTSRQNLSFISLTAHFIDDQWNLQKKILNFCPIYGHSGLAIGKAVEDCLVKWKIENIFTVTVDNASANDVGLRYLRDTFKRWGVQIALNGEHIHMRCGCHILNLVVKDGLAELHDSVERIRAAIVYVRSSSVRTQDFKKCIEKAKLHTNIVASLDVPTWWNSTYTMLDSALKLKDPFDRLEFEDEKYKDELVKHGSKPPSDEDWAYVRSFLPFLKTFYDTTLKISGSKYISENLYMREIFKVAYNIQKMGSHDDEYVRLMASKMEKNFFKYWGDWRNVNPLIYIATILDPRSKMRWVSFMVKRVYPTIEAMELLAYIETILQRLFKHYEYVNVSRNEGSSSQTTQSIDSFSGYLDDFDDELQKEYLEFQTIEEQGVVKSELDKYLSDECEKSQLTDFEVLYWWRTAGSKYPTLSRLVKDVLAIPVSTVASESAFSTGGRVIDHFRSSLTPKLVEALICAQDWIRAGHGPIKVKEVFEDIERLQFDLESNQMDVDGN